MKRGREEEQRLFPLKSSGQPTSNPGNSGSSTLSLVSNSLQLDEVVISAGRDEANIYLWELRTGAVLQSYKGNNSNINSLSVVGEDYIISSQFAQPAIHIWAWKKDQPSFKCPVGEKISSLTATTDGIYCIGGGISGKLYIWEIAGGNLLKIIDGHYKKINAIKATTDNVFFVTAGEDSLIKLWSLYSVLNSESPKPEKSWTNHTLPVTSIYVGLGGYCARIITSSLDRSCRVWNATSSDCLGIVVFPLPITALTCDQTERYIFSGATDGSIYQTKVVHAEASIQSFGGTVHNEEEETRASAFKGHSKQINALRTSLDGQFLISASDDGFVKVWHVQSGQLIRNFANHKGGVTNIEIIFKPRDLVGEYEKVPPLPAQFFKKYVASKEDLAKAIIKIDEIDVLDDDHVGFDQLLLPYKAPPPNQLPNIQELSTIRKRTQDHLEHLSMSNTQSGLQLQIKTLKDEIKTLERSVEEWKSACNRIYKINVDQVVISKSK